MFIKELAREIIDQLNVRQLYATDLEGDGRSEIRKSIELRLKEAISQLALVPKEVFDAQSVELDALKRKTLALEETLKSLESALARRIGDLDEFLSADPASDKPRSTENQDPVSQKVKVSQKAENSKSPLT